MTILSEFRDAHHDQSGPLIARTLIPIAPRGDQNRLRIFYDENNTTDPSVSIENGLLGPQGSRYITEVEGQAWVDVYVAYWKAIGEILILETTEKKVNWSKIYDVWKDVGNVLIRGYSTAGFQAWTVPCMYVVGRFLRIFAIKADMNAKDSENHMSFDDGGFQDDIIGDLGKNEKLEDAARQINRMFTLCISDRYAE